jgi:class 3 adenylate cyclase
LYHRRPPSRAGLVEILLKFYQVFDGLNMFYVKPDRERVKRAEVYAKRHKTQVRDLGDVWDVGGAAMHLQPYQLGRQQIIGTYREPVRQNLRLSMARLILMMAAVQAIGMVAATPIRPRARRSSGLSSTKSGTSPLNGKRPRRAATFPAHTTLPVHRSILAVDIEGSTKRTNPVKEELREQVYRLMVEALSVVGINEHFHDPFTDRGDGVLVLVHPCDEFPKPLLLSRLMPALARALVAHNSGISLDDQPRILRLRAVIHAGEVHYDGKGFFGEDLDVAFRLLDAPKFKAHLRRARLPLALVASDVIYRSVIRHGYDGIDDEEFSPIVTVTVGDQRRKGWVHFPRAGEMPVMVPPQAACVS